MDFQQPTRVKLSRLILRPIFRLIFHLISNVQITGVENVPSSGAYIIAINHISIIEPPLVIAFWPQAPEAVGAKEIWERKGQSTLAKFYGGIQVYRGGYDRQLIETMIKVLESGLPLLIAPEGGRSHSPGMRLARSGIAYIVDKSNAPVLPVGIVGSTDDFLNQALRLRRPRLEMRIGEIINLPDVEGRGEQRRASLKRNTDLIMYKIAELLPPGYRGVYADGNFDLSKTA
jgi:1-acyl-sn-glycerol-3-phosphate acyltransferase